MRLRVGGAVVELKLPRSLQGPSIRLGATVLAFCFVFSIFYYASLVDTGDKDLEGFRAPARNIKFQPIPNPKPNPRFGVVEEFAQGDIQPKGMRMAIDAVKDRRNLLEDVKKEILTSQVRPSDEHYNINVTLSDKMSLDRNIKDTRPPICKSFSYDYSVLRTATVVIPFYNEALSMLLRTVHSILSRTPDQLLDGIILVDDRSTDEFLKESLDRYMRLLPKVRIIRNQGREGLIKSRMIGYRACNSPVVIFQDAHTEANLGWLEPILDQLRRHPDSIVQPFVDGIDTMTLHYDNPPTMYRGAFNWELKYTWIRIPDHEAAHIKENGISFFTPTLVGCVLAVDRGYFDKIGGFDEGLKVWGGENIELGFRAWMCGGQSVTVTCSRVGHVFKNFPYKFDGNKEEIVQKNLMRVAEVWMDGLRKYFYASSRTYEFKNVEFNEEERASLQARIDLRNSMKCRNFEWYMYNVIPTLEYPPTDAQFYGELSNVRSHACFEVLDDYYVGLTYFCYEHKIIPRNYFALTSDGLLKWHDKCVVTSLPKPILKIGECPEKNSEDFGVWEIGTKGHTWGQLRVRKRHPQKTTADVYCIMQVTNVLEIHHKEQMPELAPCEKGNVFQNWAFSFKFSWDKVPAHTLNVGKVTQLG